MENHLTTSAVDTKETLLIVDDEEAIRETLIEFLQSITPQIQTVENGQVGLNISKQGGIDVIFSDIKDLYEMSNQTELSIEEIARKKKLKRAIFAIKYGKSKP